MKLYAKTTSERASKGQGGNKFLNIDITVGERDYQVDAGRVAVREDGNWFYIDYYEPSKDEGKNLLTIEQKGKKQKGEECLHNYCDDNRKCIACSKQL
jgi:hypothetical protein